MNSRLSDVFTIDDVSVAYVDGIWMTMADVSAIGITTTNSQRYVVIRKAACRVPRRL